MAKKIYQFDESMWNMVLKPDHETKEDGKKVTFRLVKGDDELNVKRQRENAEPIRFRVNTPLMVVSDETTQRWLESKPYFGSKVKIYDKAKENEQVLEGVMSNMNTVLKVSELSNEDLLGLGYQVFGQTALDMVKEDGQYDGLKVKLLAKANMDSDAMEALMDKEKNSSSTWWALAFAKGFIKEDQSGTEITWGDDHGGAKIINVTVGVKPINALTDYAMTEEGASIKQLIGQKMVNKVVDKGVVPETPTKGRPAKEIPVKSFKEVEK